MILKADSKDSTAQAKGFFYQQKLIASCLILSSYTRLNGKKMNIQAVQSRIRDGLTVSDMGFKVLKREMVNFFSILLSNDLTQF